jgi:amidohydrolase
MKDQLPGSIKLIFQPAEEGPPAGEQGGAELMVKEGVLENPKVDAIFGLHVFPNSAGTIEYRSGPLMASGDGFTITITGKQTHGAVPWAGVDPIVIGAQIVMSLQTIVSRTVNITEAPAVLTIGAFNGGNRFNIVPETVELLGTLRTFDEGVRKDVQRRMQEIVTKTAEMAGGKAEIRYNIGYPVTVNDPALTDSMVGTLRRVAGAENVRVGPLTGTSEDFSHYQQRVPGLFFFLGVTPKDRDPKTVPTNHSPLFFADESALPIGVRALTNLALDFMFGK